MVTKAFKSVKLRPLLLKWYDIHGRDLPWRTKGNIKPNPYHVWLSEVMLQQTTVATVTNYFYRFIHRWPTLNDLALASLDDILVAWQGLGYYSRARNLYKAAQHFQNLKGLPQSITDLKKLPGVGDYTAAALAAIIYGDEVVPVDGNVIRVLARVFALQQPLPLLKKAIFEKTRLLEKGERPGDFAQALMDLGAIICRSKNPMCEQCPLKVLCQAYAKGWQKKLPVPALKKPKPVRYGAVFLIQNEKREIRLRYRPPMPKHGKKCP